MRIGTNWGRWLLMAFVFASFAGTAHAQRTVTLKLNTATLPDTLRTTDEIEVRGAVGGTGGVTLPDGNIIDWNASTTIRSDSADGDYRSFTFQIPEDQELKWKFYSQLAEDDGIGGWEDGSDHVLGAGTGDTTLVLHFFEKGDDKPYDWRPFEQKEDTVAVYFRVVMLGEEATNDGFDAGTATVGVRGDDFGGAGPFGWGDGQTLELTRESDNPAFPGYHIYSGTGYYPDSLVGSNQQYKFVFEQGGTVGWEEGNVAGNRSFTIPASDTTLHWVYYGDTAPTSAEPVESAVIFAVDLSPLEAIGVFDVTRGDTLEVRGDFNGWGCEDPDRCLLQRAPGEPLFEQVIPITAIPGSQRAYKYFLNINDQAFKDQFGVDVVPSGWEEPISTTGANRTFIFEGTAGDFQDIGVQYFNDILPGNIIPEGTSVDIEFTVDMSSALDNEARPFNPAGGDSVFIQVEDPIWLFTQGWTEQAFQPLREFVLTDPDGDNVYQGTLTIDGPTYGALQYKFAYGQGTDTFAEPGGDTSTQGRRRTRFVMPNEDGSWPAATSFPAETFQVAAGALPFETNPVATSVEHVSAEVPSKIELGQNYPNPFNPSTSFEYSLTSTQHVRIRVYDVLGRAVATLVDGVQPAATYRVTFDGSELASGIYVYQMETDRQVLSKKMVLMK